MVAQVGNIRFFDRNPPTIPESDVRRVAQESFGLDGKFVPLHSEKDQNFAILSPTHGDHVIRIANAIERIECIDFQVRAMEHIAASDASLPVPRIRPNAQGQPICEIAFNDRETHIVHVVSYLPGVPAETAGLDIPPEYFYSVGTFIGRMNKALRGFFHPAADQDHPWNMDKCMRLAPFVEHFPDASARDTLSKVFNHYEQFVLPRMRKLRHQVIHQDAHAGNVLINPDNQAEIQGLIDFGDMVYGTYAADIAVATDAPQKFTGDPVDAICEVAAGFDAILPLQEEEVDLLFDLVVTRNALTATIAASRIELMPDDPVHITEPGDFVDNIDRLLAVGQRAATRRIRAACRFPAHTTISGQSTLTEAEENALCDARHKYLGRNATHFYDKPLHFERARGAFLYGTDGNRYLDCYNNVPQVGHCNPHVVKAIARQAATLNTNTRYMYSAVLEYAERLTSKLAPHLDACIFVNSGSEANDIAWQMAKRHTGNEGALIIEDAYHGITDAIQHFSPSRPDAVLPENMRGLISPDPYRGRYREDESDLAQKYASDADRAITELAADGHGIAAFMIDSALCSSGVPDVPPRYMQEVEKRVRAASGLMICDEVQSGFGRMGQWWGHEHHGVHADIVTMGKPVGNGHPLGVVVTSSDLLNEFIDKTALFSTFGGNTVACAAGNAVLDVIERDKLVDHGREVGDYLRRGLRQLAEHQPLIGDVRGHGMVTGLEFVTNRDTREPATRAVLKLCDLMREEHVLVGKDGRFGNILKLRPPLVFEKEHVDMLIAALDRCLSSSAIKQA